MRYEILNPSDKCYIHADDVRLAQIAAIYLGNGMYGLEDETGNTVLHIFQGAEVLGMSDAERKDFISSHWEDLANVFESFEYAGERSSLNNIGAKAEKLARVCRAKVQAQTKEEHENED